MVLTKVPPSGILYVVQATSKEKKMQLQNTLRRFLKRQSGTPKFTLPTGEEIDLSFKPQRAMLTRWILKLFDGDDEAANEELSRLIPNALRTAKAPWPYLLQALYNNVMENKQTHSRWPGGLTDLYKLLRSRLGHCRLDLLKKTLKFAAAQGTVELQGKTLAIDSDTGKQTVIRRLLGDDPFVLYHLLSPQFSRRYLRHNGLQTILTDVEGARFFLSGLEDSNSQRANVLDLVTTTINHLAFENTDFSEALKTCKQFYKRVSHPMTLIHRPTFGGAFRMLGSKETRGEYLAEFIQAAHYVHTPIKSAWMRQAVRLGIITSPIVWLHDVLETGFDPTEDWMDRDWYDSRRMQMIFGLRPVNSLFPDAMVCHG